MSSMTNFTEPQFWMVFGVITGGLITFGALLWATQNGDRKAHKDSGGRNGD